MNLVSCEDCGNIHDESEMLHTYHQAIICRECFENDYVVCQECGLAVKSDEAIDVAGYNCCPSCLGR
ncbi:MAG TPA: hypothetical protein VFF14_01440 [Candidatus Deferrimicrobium sp.]|nr:hypothetical protein [Candidatus Deferrimicrobium sp.]